MAKQELSRQLANILYSLAKSFLILFRMYGPLLKSILLMLLAYLAFSIGRKSVVDPLEEDVKRIRSILQNRVKYTVHFPQRIAKVKRIKLYLILTLILFIICSVMLRYKVGILMKFIKFRTAFKLGIMTLGVLFLVWTYEIMLSLEMKKGKTLNLGLNQEMFNLMKQIGTRGQSILRSTLCREKLFAKKKRPANICWKDDCIQERQYLLEKYELKQRLVRNALTFQWCSICKYKKPFNEYLQFQGLIYEANQSLNQQQQVTNRFRYLLEEVTKIINWIKNIDPCNCSKIYWISELKQIKQYKEQEKKMEEKHQIYSNRKIIRKF